MDIKKSYKIILHLKKKYIKYKANYLNLSIYSLGGLLNGLIKILTTLYIVRELSPDDFSYIGIYGSIIYFLAPFLTFGTLQLVGINFINYSEKKYKQFINKYLSFIFVLFIIVGISVPL